jgi:hypothetical protein
MTVVSAVPTTYTTPSSYATYVHPYQQNDIHVSCGYPCAYFQGYQPIQASAPILPQGNQDNPYYTIYYVNNMPYACYVHQPDILYPLQFVSDPPGQNNERVLPELVSAMTDAAGEVLQQQVSSLENYVQNMEQQAVSTVEQKVRKSCLSCIM